jgi:hypothetical protein
MRFLRGQASHARDNPAFTKQMRTSGRWDVVARSSTKTIVLHRENGSTSAFNVTPRRGMSDIDARGQRHSAGSYADHSSHSQSARASADRSSHFGGARRQPHHFITARPQNTRITLSTPTAALPPSAISPPASPRPSHACRVRPFTPPES